MIDAENLTKEYSGRRVVNDVSFSVGKGEIVGLLGPNGAGKTTTMRMLTGYLSATAGKAVIAGYNVADKPMEVRKRLGYLPETVPLYTDMPVRAYLDFTAKLRGVPGRDRKKRLDYVLDLCRLTEVANRTIGKLSRGYRQRVGLAQAIVHNPEVIILDEPTVGLDPRQIIEIRQVIRDLAGDHSMILSTHILPEVSTLCDRVIIINQGRVLVDDSLAHLERQGAESERLQVEVRGPLEGVRETLAGVSGIVDVTALTDSDEAASTKFLLQAEPGSDHREAIAAAIIGQGWGLLELKTATATLEEIFVRVISEDVERQEDASVGSIGGDEDDLDELEDSDDDYDEEEDDDYDEPAPAPIKKGGFFARRKPVQAEPDDLDDDLDEAEETAVAPKPVPSFLQDDDDAPASKPQRK